MISKCPKSKIAIKVIDKYPDGRVVEGVEYIPKATPWLKSKPAGDNWALVREQK